MCKHVKVLSDSLKFNFRGLVQACFPKIHCSFALDFSSRRMFRIMSYYSKKIVKYIFLLMTEERILMSNIKYSMGAKKPAGDCR